jgi:hypothetical protein
LAIEKSNQRGDLEGRNKLHSNPRVRLGTVTVAKLGGPSIEVIKNHPLPEPWERATMGYRLGDVVMLMLCLFQKDMRP